MIVRQIRRSIGCLSILFVLFFAAGLNGCNPESSLEQSSTIGEWPEITPESKPWARWWWMGSAVDKTNLTYLMHEYDKAGIGGLEIAPIYGAKGFEGKFLNYLSPQWIAMLHHTIHVADSLEMKIDLTQGTGWPFGGEMVTPDMAAKKMLVQQYSYEEKIGLNRPITLKDEKVAGKAHHLHTLMAFQDSKTPENLTALVSNDGTLDWDGKGTWELIAIFEIQTGQKVKRAAPGGKGFTLDHFSEAAVGNYLHHFDSAFKGDFPGIRAFYNDSFEVYGADFTGDFFNYFKKKRGYDLRDYLNWLLAEEADETGLRLKSDYRETISDMLLENFTRQWTNWAGSHGKLTKNQAHGSPGNLLDLYAEVSIPEGETFGSSYFPIPGIRRDSADIRNVDPDPIMLKFASSAAHLTGNQLVSTETFTWLGEHFKSSFSQAKPELEQAFLAGINHMFYHGITYSPREVDFPGWLFYASLNLNTHNSLWPHLNGFNAYVQRVQSVLQSGQPDNELLVYWPVYDVWADPEGLGKTLTVHGIDEWLHPTPFYKVSKSLMDIGYSVDFISDNLLNTLQVNDERMLSGTNGQFSSAAVIVPKTSFMPLATLKQLLSIARNGGRIVFQEKPADVPGFYNHTERKATLDSLLQQLQFMETPFGKEAKLGKGLVLVASDMPSALASLDLRREKLSDLGLKFIRRRLPDGMYYYLVNHTAAKIDGMVNFETLGKAAVLMDPEQGKMGLAKVESGAENTRVAISMSPGQSLIVRIVDKVPATLPSWKYETADPELISINGPWELSFVSGGPELPSDQILEELSPWTSLEGEAYDEFSGQALYENTFDVSKYDENAKYILNLGKVLESAKVWINGKEVGYAFGIPFQLDISDFVIKGENTLKIEVANLMANRIKYMDINEIRWRNYHEINFVNIDYGPFDASGWEVMPSGLVGPVTVEIHH
jgi:hypothetical protein